MSAFFGTIVVNANNRGLTVDSSNCTLTSDAYYAWHPTAASSLVDHLASVITANASSATVTASVSSDGILTLTGTASFEVTNLELYDELGFASDSLTGESEYTATSRLDATWIPGREPSDSDAPVSEGYVSRALVAQAEAPDRTVYTTEIAERRWQRLVFEFVTKARAWRTARSGAVAWWETCNDGRSILYVPDWTGSGSYSTYWIYALDLTKQRELLPKRQPEIGRADTFWSVELHLRAA